MSILENLLPAVGERIADRYELVKEIGRGGFGVVYRAVQVGLNETVAVKILLPHVIDSDDIVGRFQQEVEVAKSLRHPNSIRIIDASQTSQGLPYYVMEFVDGKPLDEIIEAEGPISPARAQRIMLQVLKSLGEAHSKGVVHRDLKPANLMVCDIHGERDFVKVLDFGIAKALTDKGSSSHMTSTGIVLGTPAYMSPEQAASARDLDGRSDLYAAGLILSECISGQPVVSGETPYVIAAMHAMPTPLSFQPEVYTSRLWPVIQYATQKQRDSRFRTAEDMAAALGRIHGLSDAVDTARMSHAAGSPSPSLPGMTPIPRQPISGPVGQPISGPMAVGQPGNWQDQTMHGHADWTPPSSLSKTLVVLLLLLLLGGGVFAGIMLNRGPDDPEITVDLRDPGEDDSDNEPSADTPDARPIAAPTPERQVVDPTLTTAIAISRERVGGALPEVRPVSFGGTDGAVVTWNDEILGTTPFEVLLPAVSKEIELTFERAGYRTATEMVSLLSPQVAVELRSRRAATRQTREPREPQPTEPTNSPFGQTSIHQ